MFPWKLIVLSGASGSGKTTCTKTLLRIMPDVSFCMLPSVTTRQPRRGDEPWYEYVDLDRFRERKLAGEFLWIEYAHKNFYGTAKESFVRSFAYGDCVITSLTPHDLRTIARAAVTYGVKLEEMLFLHIRSPREETLRARLAHRGDSPESIERRIGDCKDWDTLVEQLEKPGKLPSWDIALPIAYLMNDSTKEAFEEQIRMLFT